MRRLILALAIVVLLCVNAQAQTVNVWFPVEKGQWKTMAWDAVTVLNGNDPLPDPLDATLSYNVFVKNYNTQAIIPIATGLTATECVLILPKRARYLGGVEVQLLYAGETVPVKSTVSWSEDATVCQGGQTFGMKFQTGPKNAAGLR